MNDIMLVAVYLSTFIEKCVNNRNFLINLNTNKEDPFYHVFESYYTNVHCIRFFFIYLYMNAHLL